MTPRVVRLRRQFLLTVSVVVALSAAAAPRARPENWAAPVIDSSLDNCFRVSAELFRCEQPRARDAKDLKELGIRTILNLREYHTDSKALEKAGFDLIVHRIDTDEINLDDLVAALRLIREAPKPVMVHCWHGSDRTGSVVAAYRIVFQDWSAAEALDELRNGGFGYHERWFPNIVGLFETLDEAELRRRVLE